MKGIARDPLLFALRSSRDFAERIAHHLDVALQMPEERDFEDGEHKTRSLMDVRDRDVHLIVALNGSDGESVNDRLCKVLFFIGALKEAGAARVIVIAPYLCYARKDRQTKPHDPVTTRYVAQLFEAVGTDRLVTMDVHNIPAFQNAFRCDTEHLEASAIFCDHIASEIGREAIAVVSPDIGGAKRAELLREQLESKLGQPVMKGIADKQRSMGEISGDLFVGDVSGRMAVIVDDLISTGATMARVAAQCRTHGAKGVFIVATHGVGGPALIDNLRYSAIDRIILTNTIPQSEDVMAALRDRLSILDVSGVFAQAIKR
ncbi:ribose-phosphate diphosphokinase [Microvirga sp. 2MCAF38]|uniref:ribose-phosphate diphosphokinase n=1 Tax=Microvirga sp. 2MCAF38 TaxID=3232989 RepID=UPI003F9503D9